MKRFLLYLFFGCFSTLMVFSQQQLQNPGFENWEDVGLPVEEPVNWSSIKTSDNELLNPSAPIVWGKSDEAHSGNHSLYLINVKVEIFNVIATGTITSGRMHADVNPDKGYAHTILEDSQWNMPFTGKPDSLVVWIKANPATGDFPRIQMNLHTGRDSIPSNEENLIAKIDYAFPSQVFSHWTRFAIPVNYINPGTPEYALLILSSGNGVDALEGSEAWYDDLEFIYNGSSVNELNLSDFKAYHHQGQLFVNTSLTSDYDIRLSDLSGRILMDEQNLNGSQQQFQLNQPAGIYILNLRSNGKQVSRKIVVN